MRKSAQGVRIMGTESSFAIAEVTPGRLNALVKKMMAQMGITDPAEAVRRVNAGEWIVTQVARRWREEGDVIYLTVTSRGTTGEEWITLLENNGSRLSDYAKQVLRSPDFGPTSGITTEIVILKGTLFADSDRVTSKIRAEADKRKLSKPNAEVACLIRENFSDKEIETMGLWWIVVMHDPIIDSGGGPDLLGVDRGNGGRWLDACCGKPDDGWSRSGGFAFAVPQAIQ